MRTYPASRIVGVRRSGRGGSIAPSRGCEGIMMMKKMLRQPRPSTGLSFHPFSCQSPAQSSGRSSSFPSRSEEDSVQTKQFPRNLCTTRASILSGRSTERRATLSDLTSRHFGARIRRIPLAKRVAETTKKTLLALQPEDRDFMHTNGHAAQLQAALLQHRIRQ